MKAWKRDALLGLVGIVVIGVALLLALGGWTGRGVNDVAIEIARPPAEVFAWVGDPSRSPQWIGFVRDSRVLTPGPLRPGSQVEESLNDRGQSFPMVFTVRDWQPNRVYALSASGPHYDWERRFELSEEGGKTRLRFQAVTQYKGLVLRLASPFLTRDSQKAWERFLLDLRSKLEKP